jgi:Flp pilus assembly protein TadG
MIARARLGWVAGRARSAPGQSLAEFALVVPILMVLFIAVADLARLYTAMLTIEAAAREAADYGAFSSQYWTNPESTRREMTHRACVASSNLTDYEGTRSWPATCTNPTIVSLDLLRMPSGDACADGDAACYGEAEPERCTNETRDPPCRVKVTLRYDFHLTMPIHLDVAGVKIGFPPVLTFERTSIFAISDLWLEPSPSPSASP